MTKVASLVSNAVAHDSRVLKTARSLAGAGYEVTVVGAGPPAAWRDEGGFDVRVVSPRFGRDPWPRELRRLAPDVLHVNDTEPIALAARTGLPWVFDAHEDPFASKRADHEAIRREVGTAAAAITVSAALADRMRAELGIDAVLVHNAPLLAQGPAPEPGLRARIGVGEAPLVVYAGTITTRRRLTVVVEALADLPGVHLALVVPEEHKRLPPVLERAREVGVDDRVHVTGLVSPDAVVPFVADADVGVHPLERYDNGDIALPNKLFEYLHAGLPMVVSDTPAMAGFVREHDLGAVASVDDVAAWVGALRSQLAAPRLDARPGWNALREAWSWDAQAARLLAAYSAITAR